MKAMMKKAVRKQPAKPTGPGATKASAFIAFAESHGWAGEIKLKPNDGDDERIEAWAEKDDGRYNETIVVTWINGRVPDTASGGVLYTANNRTVKLRNVSAARQHIDGSKKQSRDAAPRRQRKIKRDHSAILGPVKEEGSGGVPIAPSFVNYELHATKKGSGPVNVTGISDDAVARLDRILAADGYKCHSYKAGEAFIPKGKPKRKRAS